MGFHIAGGEKLDAMQSRDLALLGSACRCHAGIDSSISIETAVRKQDIWGFR
jgi:hypothetical protein